MDYEKRFREFREICRKFDNPFLNAKCFHVAGSKGKGSTTAIIAGILEEAGYNVGRLSSPHVVDERERFMRAHEFFDDEIYRAAKTELAKAELFRTLSYPEEKTLTGMLCFREAKCDYTVYEVGLGGEFDPTNVISPLATGITPIELEHTKILGKTLSEIAKAKAGVIKEGAPVVVTKQKPEVLRVIRGRAEKVGAELFYIPDVVKISDVRYFLDDSYDEFSGDFMMGFQLESKLFNRPLDIKSKLVGDFQTENIAMAVIMVKIVMPEISEDIIEKGISKVRLPGRFEMLRNIFGYDRIPYIVLDGAHTISSISGSLQTLDELIRVNGVANAQDSCLTDFAEGVKPQLLFGCGKDKPVEDFAKMIDGKFSGITLTKPGDKEADFPRMQAAFSDMEVVEDTRAGILHALEKASEARAPLVVLGSLYLAGEVKKILVGKYEEIMRNFS
ncbi:bifunctional folylpolyglutamate synthase/dihydrofolate synthase [Candidatus Saccharibacteria bacterium]|nr:bifunctional folylpolyglutamate synthase/dihydrofolate synthase [Candidatus Saccharibacteria bacterium]